MADVIGISGKRRRSHCSTNLTTLTQDSRYISVIIDMLFSYWYIVHWMKFLKSPICVSNSYILQSVCNLWIVLRTSKFMVNSFWVTAFFGLQCIFIFLYLSICISISIYIYISISICLSISIIFFFVCTIILK